MSTLIPCSVDTTPMATEISRVTHQVQNTKAAVVTMQTAVIAAEKRSADKVCSNVNLGFFTLMRSQISQKIANKQSRVEALLMQLGYQKRRLLNIKSNMEREYQRIAARYIKIFTTINKELEQRIRQVDQPVFELVNKHMATSSNRMNAMAAWISTTQAEAIVECQRILMSNMKHNARVALEESRSFLAQIGRQRVLAGQVLLTGRGDCNGRATAIPVAICETVSDKEGHARTEIVMSERLSGQQADLIGNAIRSSDSLQWKDATQNNLVTEEFMHLLDKSDDPVRVKRIIGKLYSENGYKTL